MQTHQGPTFHRSQSIGLTHRVTIPKHLSRRRRANHLKLKLVGNVQNGTSELTKFLCSLKALPSRCEIQYELAFVREGRQSKPSESL